MHFLKIGIVVVMWVLGAQSAEQPNILWIYAEDTSPWMGCYGDNLNFGETPNIDSIADRGVKFTRAFVPAPVCSATRSAMMVGQNAIRFGGHEHRSSRGGTKLYLPNGINLLPEILQAHGYTTFNNGKTDYNYVWDQGAYNYTLRSKTDFSELADRQPFFGQVQTKGGKNNTSRFSEQRKVNPADVTVPADYPDHPIFRRVVAQHYDAIRMDDDLIGRILRGLDEAGLVENTIVVYFSDHGANHLLRHKQMVTEGGLHVPFVVMGPERYVPAHLVRTDLVDMLDLSATTLAWAGIEIPDWYEGRDLFADDFQPRLYVAAQKDRLDHTIDRVRSLRTERFRYVRNYKRDRIFLQPQYRDRQDYTVHLHHLYREGGLSERHRKIYFGERPAEELYDVLLDPHMIQNLAGDVAVETELKAHRRLLDEWLSLGDMGADEESIKTLMFNGENQNWGEGVNEEYEVYRTDSDGDGLSDKWERLNDRDPKDGRLLFQFDCGGWQTEGWSSVDIAENLAGYLGFLDFRLNGTCGKIQREGLACYASEQDRALRIKLRSDHDLRLTVFANEKQIGGGAMDANDIGGELEIRLDESNWSGVVHRLDIVFESAVGTVVEIDSIEVVRE